MRSSSTFSSTDPEKYDEEWREEKENESEDGCLRCRAASVGASFSRADESSSGVGSLITGIVDIVDVVP
jgi:hypothetical protein